MNPKDVKVPQVLKDLSEATKRDIGPAVQLMSRIFVGTLLGGEQSFVREIVSATAKAAATPAPRKARAQARTAAAMPPGAIVIDAEIVEEECLTCGGTRKVGRPGHEVWCPACRGKAR